MQRFYLVVSPLRRTTTSTRTETSSTTVYGNIAKTFVDETGWQVDTTGRAGYVNGENVPVISEAKQAEDGQRALQQIQATGAGKPKL